MELHLEIIGSNGSSPLDFLNSLKQWLENQTKEGNIDNYSVSLPLDEDVEITSTQQLLFATKEPLDDIEAKP